MISVCPEEEIGLGTPRNPVRIIMNKGGRELYQPSTGKKYTSEMKRFTDKYLGSISSPSGFILKYKSPSCGLKETKYYGSEENSVIVGKGPGIFTAAVIEKYPGVPIETETRLTNFGVREHFLLTVFTLARFDEIRNNPTVSGLIRFHQDNKLLLLAYNQSNMRKMGKLIAGQKEYGLEKTIIEYEKLLRASFASAARYNSHLNVLQHASGYFKDIISKKENEYFNDLLKKYTEKKLPLNAVRTVLSGHIIRFGTGYLSGQTYFDPYPDDLAEVTDSGKGRDLGHI